MTDKLIRYAGYVRISDDRQLDGYSVEAQENAIRQYVKQQNNGEITKIYYDLAKSGRHEKGRDGYAEMKADARKRAYDVLVCHKFDRLGRNLEDRLTLSFLLRQECKISIVSAMHEPSEEDGAMGKLMQNIMAVFQEFYSDNLASEVKKSRGIMIEKGKWYGARPYGYVKNEDTGILEPHPHELEIVRWIYDTYLEGKLGFKSIVNLLNKRGEKTVRGRAWVRDGVANILTSRTYLGELRRQETTYTSDGTRKYDEPINWFPGKHPPLVTQEQFDKAAAIMAERDTNIRPSKHHDYLLQGKVYCGSCFDFHDDKEIPVEVNEVYYGRMITRMRKSRSKAGTEFPYYACRLACGHGNIRADFLDEQVIEFLLRNDLPDLWRNDAISLVADVMDKEKADARTREIKAILQKMDYRHDHGLITDIAAFEEQYRAMHEEMIKLQPLIDDSYQRAADLVNNFPKHWYECGEDFQKRRALVLLLVDRVTVVDGRLDSVVMKPDYRMVFPESTRRREGSQDRPFPRWQS